ncbi:MAG: uracil-DNA glycosylase, partial [Acidobacteria bacterium]|nr:uracil-DNA glycosylase [Acidobacteriota bacterium]
MNHELLRQYVAFYQDLGLKSLYRRTVTVAPEPDPLPALSPPLPEPPPVMPDAAPLFPVIPDNDSMPRIRQDLGECTRCFLHRARHKIVFGDGNESSPLVFVGEGPGADEDEQGIPFVGRAGQLLTQMIENTAAKEGIPLKRADVYICNVVKCRPPENRTPEPDEMEMCGQFL